MVVSHGQSQPNWTYNSMYVLWLEVSSGHMEFQNSIIDKFENSLSRQSQLAFDVSSSAALILKTEFNGQ
jgi:hypothetical protein